MLDQVRPITPDEVVGAKNKILPAAVLEAFNELIAKKFLANSATIKQDDLVALMEEKGLERNEIFDNGLLNMEDVYRAVGWEVVYDKPGFNESYAATFTFRRARK